MLSDISGMGTTIIPRMLTGTMNWDLIIQSGTDIGLNDKSNYAIAMGNKNIFNMIIELQYCFSTSLLTILLTRILSLEEEKSRDTFYDFSTFDILIFEMVKKSLAELLFNRRWIT